MHHKITQRISRQYLCSPLLAAKCSQNISLSGMLPVAGCEWNYWHFSSVICSPDWLPGPSSREGSKGEEPLYVNPPPNKHNHLLHFGIKIAATFIGYSHNMGPVDPGINRPTCQSIYPTHHSLPVGGENHEMAGRRIALTGLSCHLTVRVTLWQLLSWACPLKALTPRSLKGIPILWDNSHSGQFS